MTRNHLGVGLLAAGIAIATVWNCWFYTRSWCPIDTPIALEQGGHVETPEFKLNIASRYELAVSAGRPLTPEKLECLLGSVPPSRCTEAPVLHVHWTVSGNGRVVQGTSEQTAGSWETLIGSTGEVSHSIGMFDGVKGGKYRAIIDILADGTKLTPANPRLQVTIVGTQYESAVILNQLLDGIAALLVLSGLFLVVIEALRVRRARSHLSG